MLSPYLRGLRWPVGSEHGGNCFSHSSFSSLQAQSAGMVQLHPIRLLQTGRERSHRKHWNAQSHLHECFSLLTRARWALWWRKPRLWNAAIFTRGTLFSGADSSLRVKSAHTVSQQGIGLQTNFALPCLTQMQKSLVLKALHLLRSNQGCPYP